ncbi:MAG: glycosyltransferase family 4 protein [Promethearchaeota archaeon]
MVKLGMSNSKVAKIMFITGGIYPWEIGGVEIHCYYVAKYLSSEFKVSILSRSNNVKLSTIFNNPNVFLISIPHIPYFSSIIFILKGLIIYLLKIRQVDLVHVHQVYSPAILGFLISKLHRVPLIITCHGSDIRLHHNILVKFIQNFLLKQAQYITAVSVEIKKILIQHYGINASKICVIPNGYDEQIIKKIVHNAKNKNKVKIVFVGNLRPIKDPLTLLKGFKKVIKKYPNIKLQIVGDGSLKGYLEVFCRRNNLSSKVVFEGKKAHKETLKIISESTIFVLTSIQEGLPTALIEAMALGKPVVATNVGGIPEVIRHRINGILVPPQSPKAVSEALDKLITSPALREKLSTAAAESVKNYTWSKIAEQYKRIYSKVLHGLKGVKNG